MSRSTHSPIEYDVIDEFSPLLRRLNERAKKIAGNVKVTVKDDPHVNSKLTVNQLATIHTKGSRKKNIPARSFIEPALRQNTTRYLKFIATKVPLLLLGRTNSGEVMDDMGAIAVDDVIDYINKGNFAPLKPATIKRKGHAKPLIETSQLKRSIIAVRDGGRDDPSPWRGF